MDTAFNYFSLVVYVPESHLEIVKKALFEAGAGQLGNYNHCCWQVLGQGQFKPNKKSSPFIGSADELSQLEEYRIECLCPRQIIKSVLAALEKAHPYETPAYSATPAYFIEATEH